MDTQIEKHKNIVADSFRKNGYVVVSGVLNKEDINPVFNEYSIVLDQLISGLSRLGKLKKAYDNLLFLDRMSQFISETGSRYHKNFESRFPYEVLDENTPIHLGPAIFNLMRNKKLNDVIEIFIGPEISSNPVNTLRIKPPQQILPEGTIHAGVSETPWHQDFVNYPSEAKETQILTVWIAMTDSTEEMGCLRVIPGSHKAGLDTHCPADDFYKKFNQSVGGGIPEELINGKDAVSVPVNAGDVIFLHRLTKHATLPNFSNKLRWSFDLRYHPTHQFSGHPLKPSWVTRSKDNPSTEIKDWKIWARMWRDAQSQLVKTKQVPIYIQYSPENPLCAPS